MTSFKSAAISRYKVVENAAHVALSPTGDTFDYSCTLCPKVLLTLMAGSRRLVSLRAGLIALAVLVRIQLAVVARS